MSRQRKTWTDWIPATILAAAIIAIISAALILVSGGLGQPAPAPTAGQVTEKNLSIFTEDGLAYIDKTREVRFNLSAPPVDAAELGLDNDGSLTIGPHAATVDYYLFIYGGAEGQGGDKFTVSELTIETNAGAVASIRAPLSEVLNFHGTLNALLAKAELFGWDTSTEAAIIEMVGDASRDGVPYQFGFGPGTAIGVPVAATATCGTRGYCLIEYELTPTVR